MKYIRAKFRHYRETHVENILINACSNGDNKIDDGKSCVVYE